MNARPTLAATLALSCSVALSPRLSLAQAHDWPPAFRIQDVATNGTTVHVRVGGKGPAVLLLHGYGETGDMWPPLAAVLMADHTVVVPDLRGMGLSARPATGYDKKTQGADVAGVLDALDLADVDLVTHDIGNMVGYAFAVRDPSRIRRFVIIDAPLPGIGPWDEITHSHALWHFSFWGPDAERLVAGRERIYLDRFWNEFSADPKNFPEEARRHYAALYARPGAMHAGFEQFKAFDRDAEDNKAALAATGKLAMPVLAVGGEKSFGSTMAAVMRFVATDVHEAIVPAAGHWVMEENPTATIALVRDFLSLPLPGAAAPRASTEIRLAPSDFDVRAATSTPGTSGVAGIRTSVLKGDPAKAGLYTILLSVPPHTRIAAHSHPDDRIATVISGTWYFGYGRDFDASRLRALPAGSFYSEPPGDEHFAETRDSEVLVQISGVGPTATTYVRAEDTPRP